RFFGFVSELPGLALIFALLLVCEPVLLIGVAALLTRLFTGSTKPLLSVAVRYSYSLAPIGFGIWLAHYGFHFLTGLYTFIPVAQSALAELGFAITPHWGVPGWPPNVVQLFEFGFITLGLIGSLLVSYSIAVTDHQRRAFVAFIPWAAVSLIIAAAAFWLMMQPMEMRGVALGG
ncbi:MAG TPA: hypothetical protein VJS17_11825, partial [Pyrinomonadaceae bacterium]|nr:hypothetical protein [Pyrinomonadaceae bacterium]